jgi:hypothetical protein
MNATPQVKWARSISDRSRPASQHLSRYQPSRVADIANPHCPQPDPPLKLFMLSICRSQTKRPQSGYDYSCIDVSTQFTTFLVYLSRLWNSNALMASCKCSLVSNSLDSGVARCRHSTPASNLHCTSRARLTPSFHEGFLSMSLTCCSPTEFSQLAFDPSYFSCSKMNQRQPSSNCPKLTDWCHITTDERHLRPGPYLSKTATTPGSS